LGKWDIHTYPIKLIKTEVKQQPRIVDGYHEPNPRFLRKLAKSRGRHPRSPRVPSGILTLQELESIL
jgi:hypothetical protein